MLCSTIAEQQYITFLDWAESFIAHPFYSLVVIQRSANYIFGDGFTQMDQLRGYYLSAWTAYAPLERLHEAFQLAQSLGTLCRGLTWYHYVRQLERRKYADAWPHWLKLFLASVE